MARRANPTVIGAFIVGAVVLAVGGVFLFGTGRFFADTQKYVLYFEESLKGLNVGAPVTLGGVEIGSVTDIRLQFDVQDMDYRAPVVIEIDRDTFSSVHEHGGGARATRRDPWKSTEMLIEKGLRAQLQTRSFVTGLLQVSLDFHPETEPRMSGAGDPYPEIPTIPTTLEQLSRTLESMPIQDLVANLEKLTRGLEALVDSPRLDTILASLDDALQNLNALTTQLQTETGQVSAQLREGIADLRGMVGRLDRQVEPVASRLSDSLASARDAFEAATETIEGLAGTAALTSDVQQQLAVALEELASAARAVRQLADYLERHPESLLRGKGDK